MATILPSQLPAASSVNNTAAIIVDTGSVVQKATPAQLLDAAAPVASEAEALAGEDNTKRMTALRTRQALGELVSDKAMAGAVGISGDAVNLGTFTSPLIDDNATVKAALESVATNLAASTGAARVGFRQDGADAVTRTLEDKSRDYLFAADYGVIGDGVVDDTAAAQAFLDECQTQNKTAYFGSLCVKVTGALTSRVGIVFDGLTYGTFGEPGFYPTGSGYTVLTQLGFFITDYSVAIYGTGTVTYNETTGVIATDTRTAVNGIAFGDPNGTTNVIGEPGDPDYFVGFSDPFAANCIRSVRVFNLSGFGVKNTAVWDTTFEAVSVELCGNSTHYAFSCEAPDGSTCNETTWARVQIERSIHKAIYVHPLTLACTFAKIHVERQVGVSGSLTFMFGGSNTWLQVRAQAINPAAATCTIESQQADFIGYRGEGGLITKVNASGGTVNFHSPLAIFQPVTDQTGIVNVFGGQCEFQLLQQGWNVYGGEVSNISCGFSTGDQHSAFHNCTIATFGPTTPQSTGSLRFYNCQIAAGVTIVSGTQQMRDVRFMDGTVFTPTSGAITFGYHNVVLDTTSRIVGNVTLDFATGNFDGTITGNLTVAAGLGLLAGMNAVVTGTITGWSAPTTGAHQAGEFSKNLQAPGLGGAVGYLCITDGTPGTWEETGIVGAVRSAFVADPAGGATVDTEGRAATAAIIDALIAANLMVAS